MKLEARLSKLSWWIVIILICVAVGQFSSWGYEVMIYILSSMFHITTDTTIFQFFTGIVTVIASFLVFLGSIYAWNAKKSSFSLLMIGSVGFILKNSLEIIHKIVSAQNTGITEIYQVQALASDLGSDLSQIVFWILIIIWISKSLERLLTESSHA